MIDSANIRGPGLPAGGVAVIVSALWLVLVTGGCQLLPTKPDQASEPSDPVEIIEDPIVLLPATMQQVIDLLDTGRTEDAESVLLRIVDARPGHSLALRLLEQIQRDPIALMGEKYDEIEVSPGESLSAIAGRELGDPMYFFALARYNRITVPRQLVAGTRLRIPLQLKVDPEMPDELAETPMQPLVSAQERGEGLALTGRQLLERGRHQQALALLLAAARSGNLDAGGEDILIRAGYARSEELVDEGRLEEGLDLVDQLIKVVAEPAANLIRPQRGWIQSRLYYREGLREYQAGNLPQALEWFDHAVALEAGDDESVRQAAAVRQEIVVQIHERALVHYRSHELKNAIELWEQALAVDDAFEPAQVYLPRARALQARLRELED